MSALAQREERRLPLIALVHHPLALEAGLEPALRARLFEGEREALRASRRVLVTSRATVVALADYGVDPASIDVVEPGTDPAPLARGSNGSSVHLLAVAALIPRKGYEVLLRALSVIPERNWQLTCVGSADRHRSTAEKVSELIQAGGLEGHVRLAGELAGDDLASAYDEADVFVLPTLFEGYGMAVAEALARGLPVISTNTGAIPDLLSDGAGLLLDVGNGDQLEAALSRVLQDEELRRRLGANARRTRMRLSTWDDAAQTLGTALERVTR
jgi:glycosyltransferase involved in cell wall biosynthesis